MQIDRTWIPLREALYGAHGLYPDFRRADVFKLTKTIERVSRVTGVRHHFLPSEVVAELRQLAEMRRALAISR